MIKLPFRLLCWSLLISTVSLGLFAAGQAKYVPGEMIIKLQNQKMLSSILDGHKELGINLKRSIKLSYETLYVLSVENKSSANMEMVQQQLIADPRIDYAEPNYLYRIVRPIRTVILDDILAPLESDTPYTLNDPKFSQLWGLRNDGTNGVLGGGVAGADIDALRAWSVERGSHQVKIAIIDTGIDYNHPDLQDNLWVNMEEQNGTEGVDDDGNGYIDDIYGYDFANRDADPLDGHSHGTHCAGTIGAVHNNNAGVAGVMADVTLMGVKVFTDGGSGSTENAILGIDYAMRMGVDLMSNSWGGGPFSQALLDSITRASEQGIIFTAAAGNSTSNNDSSTFYPANYDVPNVVAVASHTSSDRLSSFSSYGRTMVDIAAPGSDILSTTKNGKYGTMSGTSMATPHVSGVLGLLIAHEGRIPHQVMRERLLATSQPVRAYRRKVASGGRINAYNLLTNTRPPRNEPDPSAWIDYPLDEVFESDHPYAANDNLHNHQSEHT